MIMRCPVGDLPYLMSYEEMVCWAYRYEYGKYGYKVESDRAAIIAKCAAEAFSDGKKEISLDNYKPTYDTSENMTEKTTKTNLMIANNLFGGIVPKKVIDNGNSSKPDSTTEA